MNTLRSRETDYILDIDKRLETCKKNLDLALSPHSGVEGLLVLNNFYPSDLLVKAIQCAAASRYRWGWGDVANAHYWNIPVAGRDGHEDRIRKVEKDIGESLNGEDKEPYRDFSQECFENLFNYFCQKGGGSFEFSQIYCNLHTFGAEGFPHIDNEEGGTTVINYLCYSWDIRWGGATAFYSDPCPSNREGIESDIEAAIIPKFNRVVIFDSRKLHGVIPLSKMFGGERVTMMFKLDMDFKDVAMNFNK
jgi:hypothetical protein